MQVVIPRPECGRRPPPIIKLCVPKVSASMFAGRSFSPVTTGSGRNPNRKDAAMMESILPHAREYMFFSLIAQTFTSILLVLIWLEQKKKK